MKFDAIILAGGRSSRLHGTDKAQLRLSGTDRSGTQNGPLGETMLQRACGAVSGASRLVVVGPVDPADLAEDIIVTREDPPYGGPAAAISAGFAALGPDPSPSILIMACDMPGAAEALPYLWEAAALHRGADGVLARSDDGQPQQLLGIYRPQALAKAIGAKPDLNNVSVRALISPLDLVDVAVPESSTMDVDTWDDARLLGINRKD